MFWADAIAARARAAQGWRALTRMQPMVRRDGETTVEPHWAINASNKAIHGRAD
jgi:hypothetical protein